MLTRFAGNFGPPIAEWCFSRIIEHERHFTTTTHDQRNKQWEGSKDIVTKYRYLSSLTVSVLGCGDIGTHIARVASTAFNMKTIGFGKSKRTSSNDYLFFDEYTTDLVTALKSADYIISVLPSTPGTKLLLSHNDVLSHASINKGGKKPVFINVGRGNVINESSLIYALDNNYLAAAMLDVFEIEPLPESSKLWGHPKITISPHVIGLTQAKDVPCLFFENYHRYVKGEQLLYVVDWDKGY